MPRRATVPAILILAVLAALFVAAPAGAQDDELQVTIDPEQGADGATVTISGSGAQANEEVVVSVAPWNQDQSCDTPRDGDTVETVTADENGEFSATHTAERFGTDHVGNTYFAYVPMGGAEEPMSNLACFEFGEPQEPDTELSIDISPEAGAPDSNVTISGSGAPANAEVIVSYATWIDGQDCRAPRGGETIETVTANEDGEFSATHTAVHSSPELVGYTYFAYIPTDESPQPRSNLECFPLDIEDNPSVRHFDQTGHWVTDRFLEYWDNNGALPIFGYPLTDDSVEDGRTTQYFERQRFELHPDNERPFDVLLGHLGQQAAGERDLLDTEPFQPVDGAGDNEDCLYFEETGHRVCHGFLDEWESYGLELGDEGVSQRESVMLFGYPISEEFTDPDTGLTVQYFERAKLEYHPDNEAPWDVIPERLGATLYDR